MIDYSEIAERHGMDGRATQAALEHLQTGALCIHMAAKYNVSRQAVSYAKKRLLKYAESDRESA